MQPLESRIGYKFRNSFLLAEALTHPSLAYESQRPHFDNQRLEFLGDAVLQLILTEELFKMFPDFPEGRLTKLRSRVVSRRALARFAMTIHLGDYVLLGKGEESTGGRRRLSTLADAFEALIGAVYLDSGVAASRELVLRLLQSEIGGLAASPEERNPKGELQECLQSLCPQAPTYRIIGESGPDHRRVFQAEVAWQGLILATGKGKSKKEAEARAASEALRSRVWEREEWKKGQA
ncbi:ribonuclease III [Luteolibacter ambystomatis]|uniref:Ribonuclease 3 n=1 Tax=Luteolibacter ambystomatis TaxID=2824561 RepID=A0A975IZN4_9BACT|nr:ribonuclease III [Luteolibacter ambystomatis]QUE51133.1 ribonuclease III [Luteolibacter ambystomatis]